jgi:hypothetical protein
LLRTGLPRLRTLTGLLAGLLARALSQVLLHSLPRALLRRRSGGGRSHHQRIDDRMLFGEVRIQAVHVPAQFLRCLLRPRKQGGMDRAAVQVRAHAHPSQRRVLESGLGLVRG